MNFKQIILWNLERICSWKLCSSFFYLSRKKKVKWMQSSIGNGIMSKLGSSINELNELCFINFFFHLFDHLWNKMKYFALVPLSNSTILIRTSRKMSSQWNVKLLKTRSCNWKIISLKLWKMIERSLNETGKIWSY